MVPMVRILPGGDRLAVGDAGAGVGGMEGPRQCRRAGDQVTASQGEDSYRLRKVRIVPDQQADPSQG